VARERFTMEKRCRRVPARNSALRFESGFAVEFIPNKVVGLGDLGLEGELRGD